MIKNYFKTAFRNLWKNKTYGFLNIFGLTIGVVCAGLIFLWVEDELSYDNFNEKKDQLYFVQENQKVDTRTSTLSSTPGLLGPAMQAEIPGVANTCRTSEGTATFLFSIGDRSMYAGGKYVEPSLFTMFTLPFVQGNAATAFKELHSIVITEKTAKKFFGNDKDVLGKSVRVNNKQDFVVTGVLKDIPDNSSLQFEWVVPFEIFFRNSEWLHKWGNNSLSTYVELKPGADPATVNKLLYDFIQKREPTSIARPFLFSMNDWRLRDKFDNGVQTGGGRIEYVRLFSLIAIIILLIACINFMNLATARSEKRAKEVGVRKVLGSTNTSLIYQFLGEALLMAFFAGLLAIIMIALALPAFNLMVQKHLSLGLDRPFHVFMLLSIILVCGLLSGSYPSFYLSLFNPAMVLKGLKQKAGSANLIRNGLVVMQFTVSIVLIIGTIVIYQQIQHVKSRNLGLDKNNLLQTEVTGNVGRHYAAIKQELLGTGLIEDVALSDHITLYGGNNTYGLTWMGKPRDAKVVISQRYVSTGFFHTSGIRLLQGRDIAETDSAMVNKTIHIVITQSLEKLMGEGSALDKKIWYDGDGSGVAAQVVGVVNDYVYGDMYAKPDPVMFFYSKPENTTEMYVRFKPQADIEKTVATVESVMKQYNPGYPFSYQFVDEQFNRIFMNEELISKLSRVFAVLAIVISCLGLFALASYATERRIKEIGVRKVLGATVTNITALLSKDFLKLIGLSCLLAFPLAWWIMNNWLQNYQYRVAISWWNFPLAGILVVLIALATVSFQSIKAAISNPVKSLRTE
ncbi:duplicated orphan permease [Hydrobacter penzbergensis]|uniref:Duplicated orphan permease n=1 Tax=Hydrobacter penzbergensis TaxID=1235997 RepID=A0A8X8L9Z9_9BACT|nr:ABC transporter permease [Hydrobacter penzbergensis]SDW17353.1 duplicated orphan permease [Hydrobacter penzbergensis]